ncbi:carboxypeptidase [Halobacteriales archaeon SW_12_69_24]|nr:MAG: carboxypeptidase [Halobacteriales archaeon SW_12_69_24]
MAPERAATPDAYDDLLEQYGRATYLGDANMILSWDQEVMMPEGGTPARAKQRGAVSAMAHDLLVDDNVGDWLDDLEAADLDGDRAAVVREIRREYDRKAKVPTDLVEEISQATSDAHPVWQEAKAEDDWERFAPTVEHLLDLKRAYADHIDPGADPYAVLFADYEPYLDLETAERVLERLRDRLVPLLDEIRASDPDLHAVDGTFPEPDQMELAREALQTLEYDFEHGRIDTAPHPFSSGTQFDARVTTRFDESEPLESLGSTIHEFGHASYTQGLSKDDYGTPLGEHRGLTVHESHANRVYEDNLIRVEADELTYHLHIILRFEIERDLIAGDLDVAEVPAVWNDKMDEYLGVRPDADGEGCLQDIHWSHGSFGYFPTYSLGSVLAAQLYTAAAAEIDDLESKIRAGEVGPLRQWLTDTVHGHGRRYTTDDLVREATGESFTADYFLKYAEEKFGALYDLGD